MDFLDKFFATVMAINKTSLAVRAAVGLGKHHLNKYYGLTDTFPACQITFRECCFTPSWSCLSADIAFAVLHPARRLAYLKHMRWEQKWIDNLVEVTWRIFKLDYVKADELLDVMPVAGWDATAQVRGLAGLLHGLLTAAYRTTTATTRTTPTSSASWGNLCPPTVLSTRRMSWQRSSMHRLSCQQEGMHSSGGNATAVPSPPCIHGNGLLVCSW